MLSLHASNPSAANVESNAQEAVPAFDYVNAPLLRLKNRLRPCNCADQTWGDFQDDRFFEQGPMAKACKTAMHRLEVEDGFRVLRTSDSAHTFRLYQRITNALQASHVQSGTFLPTLASWLQSCGAIHHSTVHVQQSFSPAMLVNSLWFCNYKKSTKLCKSPRPGSRGHLRHHLINPFWLQAI